MTKISLPVIVMVFLLFTGRLFSYNNPVEGSIKVNVSWSSENRPFENDNIDIHSIAGNILKYTGLEVIKSDSIQSRYVLRINFAGNALSKTYQTSMSPSFGTRLYTGAHISGNIFIESKGFKKISTNFSSTIDPPDMIQYNLFSGGPNNPAKAPFENAFIEGEFYDKMIEVFYKLLGENFLTVVLKADEKNIQMKAIRFAGTINNNAFSEMLYKLMTEDKESVRFEAALSLGHLGDVRALNILVPALKDSSDATRTRTIYALGNVKTSRSADSLIPLLQDESINIRRTAAFVFSEMKHPATIPPLIDCLSTSDKDLYFHVRSAIIAMKDESITKNLLAETFQNTDNLVRIRILEIWGSMRDRSVIDLIHSSLKNQDVNIQVAAINALEALQDESSVSYLIGILEEYKNKLSDLKWSSQLNRVVWSTVKALQNITGNQLLETDADNWQKWWRRFRETVSVSNENMVLVEGSDYEYSIYNEPKNVKIDNYLISIYEVTFKQYDLYCEFAGKKMPDDEGFGRNDNPVINVSWLDAVNYCNWRSRREGLSISYRIDKEQVYWDSLSNGYRLPTVAEWEFASKGGKKCSGFVFSGSNDYQEIAWYRENSDEKPHKVGIKKTNELGIYDMCGNVSEMCFDGYLSINDNDKIVKGGHYQWSAKYGKIENFNNKIRCSITDRSNVMGFRIVRTP